jgi:hypothetical protein
MSDPVDDLEKTAELLPAAAAGVRLGDRASRHLLRFADAERQKHRLKALAEFAVLVDGRVIPQVKDQVLRALASASEASKAMEDANDEETLEDAVEEYQTYIQSLASLEGLVRPLWTQVVNEQFGPLGSVGMLLHAFPSARDLGQRMVQAASEARRDNPGAIIDLLPKAKALLALRKTLVAEQEVVAGNPRVAAFLQALADNRATLDLLEPEVLDWLKGQGALTSLKVTTAHQTRNL